MEPIGLFRTTIEIEGLAQRGLRLPVPDTLGDSGSELTWVPRAILEPLGNAAPRAPPSLAAPARRPARCRLSRGARRRPRGARPGGLRRSRRHDPARRALPGRTQPAGRSGAKAIG